MVATSTSTSPTHSIGQGGDQPLNKNVPITPTCGGGSLPDTGKVGKKEGGKEKEKEKEKSVAKPASPIQVINLDGDTKAMDG